MSKIRVLHNPKAGEGNYSEDEIVSLFGRGGHQVAYTSIKSAKWSQQLGDEEILAIGGGDG